MLNADTENTNQTGTILNKLSSHAKITALRGSELPKLQPKFWHNAAMTGLVWSRYTTPMAADPDSLEKAASKFAL